MKVDFCSGKHLAIRPSRHGKRYVFLLSVYMLFGNTKCSSGTGSRFACLLDVNMHSGFQCSPKVRCT